MVVAVWSICALRVDVEGGTSWTQKPKSSIHFVVVQLERTLISEMLVMRAKVIVSLVFAGSLTHVFIPRYHSYVLMSCRASLLSKQFSGLVVVE